jgi:hypothetical protein
VLNFVDGAVDHSGMRFVQHQMTLMEQGKSEEAAYELATEKAEEEYIALHGEKDALASEGESAFDLLASIQEEESEQIKTAMRTELEKARAEFERSLELEKLSLEKHEDFGGDVPEYKGE